MQNHKSLYSFFWQQKKSIIGMSLIEILIAITLLAFIGLGTITMMDNSFQIKESVLKEDNESLQVEAAMSRFEKDFSQIYSPLFYSRKKVAGINTKLGISQVDERKYSGNRRFVFEDQYGHPVPRIFNPDAKTIEFFTSSNRRKMENIKQSDYAWARYTLVPSAPDPKETNPKRTGLYDFVRAYSADNPYSDDDRDLEDIKHFKLLTHVSKLKFYFWDPVKLKFVESLREVQGMAHLLWAIQVELTWIDSAGISNTTKRTFRSIWPKQEIEDLARMQAEVDRASGVAPPPDIGSGQ